MDAMSKERILVSEVGPRDGLQIERTKLSTADKVRLIEALAKAGLSRIEVGAFVHPKIVPQMADSAEVLAQVPRPAGVRYGAFVPNAKGAEKAIAAGVDDLKAGIAVSDTFNELNVRMTTETAMGVMEEINAAASGVSNVRILGVVATAFGCPYEGPVSPDRLYRIFDQLVSFGCPVIYLADTTGMAIPNQVSALVGHLRERWPKQTIGLHLHNTRGLGLANALAGVQSGVRDFESSIGGLGGCPFAPRAVGNISTEDFVHMAEAMNFDTGLDLGQLITAAEFAQKMLGRTLPGMVMKAGPATTRFEKASERLKVD
jgi:hydroxymethylglutaryl-CoA lyase